MTMITGKNVQPRQQARRRQLNDIVSFRTFVRFSVPFLLVMTILNLFQNERIDPDDTSIDNRRNTPQTSQQTAAPTTSPKALPSQPEPTMNKRPRKSLATVRAGMWAFDWRHKEFVEEFNISPDLVGCNLPLFLFLNGESKAGKSSFVNRIMGMNRLSVEFFVVDDFVAEFIKVQVLAQGKVWTRTTEADLAEEYISLQDAGYLPRFVNFIAGEIKNSMEGRRVDVLIVDVAMLNEDYQKKIHQAIDPGLDYMLLDMHRGSISFNDFTIVDAAVRHPFEDTAVTVQDDREELSNISADLTAHNFLTHLEHIYYRHFLKKYSGMAHCIEQKKKSIFSQLNPEAFCFHVYYPQKIEHLNVPDLTDKRVLDVDSGLGYYAGHYAALDARPKQVIAIDSSSTNVKNAQCFNSMLMGLGTSDILTILERRFLDLGERAGSFDVISCLSTFNSYQDQSVFMKKVKQLLIDDGVLILVVGMNTEERDEPYTESRTIEVQDKDFIEFYPNIEQLKVLTKDLNLLYWGPTFEGDPVSGRDILKEENDVRMVFHFSRQHNEKKISFPNAIQMEKVSKDSETCNAEILKRLGKTMEDEQRIRGHVLKYDWCQRTYDHRNSAWTHDL